MIDFLLELSCEKQGISEVVPSIEKTEQSIYSYFTVLSSGINRSSGSVIWTEPYNDYDGLGQMTTAAFPIYDYTTTIPYLIGVAGMDILMSDIYSFDEKNYATVLEKLTNRSIGCEKINLNDCQLEYLRSENTKCTNLKYSNVVISKNCQSIRKPLICNVLPISSPLCLYSPVEGDLNLPCCGTENCAGYPVGTIATKTVIVIIIIIVAIIGFVYWKNRNSENIPQGNVEMLMRR